MDETLSREQFLNEVKDHVCVIERDDGVFRHVRFSRPNDSCMHFTLSTIPGKLIYSGDMGCFVFQRLHDMFQFFRTDRAPDFGYWHQKLIAVDRNDGSQKKSFELLDAALRSYLSEDSGYELTGTIRDEIQQFIDDLRTEFGEYGFDHAAKLASDFCVGRPERPVFAFQDLFDHNFDVFTHRFVWACYAIQWGIRKYDEVKAVRD